MKRAIIVGSEGQDGRLLFDRLSSSGWAVLGLGRNSARVSSMKGANPVDILNRTAVASLFEDVQPHAVFYVAAFHQSSESALRLCDVDLFQRSHDIHVKGLINILEGLASQDGSLFYAASSHVFGNIATSPQTEETPFEPATPYAITKAAGIHVCRYYRSVRRVRASVGILYNHESRFRSPDFVSAKIVRSAARIVSGQSDSLRLGNLQSRIDWGYAPDFVDAMLKVAELREPDDFIVATGETHSVGEFAEIAFSRVGLDWRDHVVEDRSILTRVDTPRVGDASRLRQRTGWCPSVSFREMVEILTDAALEDHVG